MKQLYFNGAGQLQAIRQREWKLFLNAPPAPEQKAKAKVAEAKQKTATAAGPALFNLVDDLAEANDVAAAHPDVVARLKTLATEMESEIKSNQRPAGEHVDKK